MTAQRSPPAPTHHHRASRILQAREAFSGPRGARRNAAPRRWIFASPPRYVKPSRPGSALKEAGPMETPMPETLVQIFLDSATRYRKAAMFMHKAGGAWQSVSAERARADVENLALGLKEMGIQRGDKVAILSENRYEWPIADLAVLALGAVTVPIYPTLTADQCGYILQNSEARAAFTSTPAQLAKLR